MVCKQTYNPSTLDKVRVVNFVGVFDFYYLG